MFHLIARDIPESCQHRSVLARSARLLPRPRSSTEARAQPRPLLEPCVSKSAGTLAKKTIYEMHVNGKALVQFYPKYKSALFFCLCFIFLFFVPTNVVFKYVISPSCLTNCGDK